MIPVYYLYYETITGGHYQQRFTVLFDFAKALDQAMENSYVNQPTIKLWTEKGAP